MRAPEAGDAPAFVVRAPDAPAFVVAPDAAPVFPAGRAAGKLVVVVPAFAAGAVEVEPVVLTAGAVVAAAAAGACSVDPTTTFRGEVVVKVWPFGNWMTEPLARVVPVPADGKPVLPEAGVTLPDDTRTVHGTGMPLMMIELSPFPLAVFVPLVELPLPEPVTQMFTTAPVAGMGTLANAPTVAVAPKLPGPAETLAPVPAVTVAMPPTFAWAFVDTVATGI